MARKMEGLVAADIRATVVKVVTCPRIPNLGNKASEVYGIELALNSLHAS
jgi:hypothetical protein